MPASFCFRWNRHEQKFAPMGRSYDGVIAF